MANVRVAIVAEPLDITAEIERVTGGRGDIGAVVTFTGLCRDEDGRLEALELAAQRKDGTADLLGSGLPGISGRLPDLVRVEAGWEAATSAALSALAESVVVADQAAALAAVELLRSHDLGRAGVLVVDFRSSR